MLAFDPLFRNPHLQTIAGHLWTRDGAEARYPLQPRFYQTEHEVSVLVQSQYPEGPARGNVVMVHGLEGSGEAGYVRSLSGAALRGGFAAHRFHMRTCGGTERLCNTLYHAGLTSDLRYVLHDFQRTDRRPAFLVGFSLGGNVVMKLAGEMGEEACPLIGGVCAVSAPLDLAKCAWRVSHPENRLYQRRFVRRMSERLMATGRYHKRDFSGLRSVREIDDRITAPSFGFGDAANYYRTQSALPYLEGLRVPALLIHAKDDTMAPFESCESDAVRSNPRITLLATEHGGHLGFIARRPHRFWLDETIMSRIATQVSY